MVLRSRNINHLLALALCFVAALSSNVGAQTRFEFAKDWPSLTNLSGQDTSSIENRDPPSKLSPGRVFAQQSDQSGTNPPPATQTGSEPVKQEPQSSDIVKQAPAGARTEVLEPQPLASDNQSQTQANDKLLKPKLPDSLQKQIDPVAKLTSEIEELIEKVDRLKFRDDALVALRPQIDDAIFKAETAVKELQPTLLDIKEQIAKLGPAPDGKDIPEDAPEIALEREHLNSLNSSLTSAIKQAELGRARATQLRGQVQTHRQNIFTKNLFQRTSSPLLPSTWKDVFLALPRAFDQIQFIVSSWWQTHNGSLGWIFTLLAFAIVIFFALRNIIRATLISKLPVDPDVSHSFLTRAATAGWATAAMALPAVSTASVLYFVFHMMGLFDERSAPFVKQVYLGVLIYAVAAALANAYLQPNRQAWRLIDISTPAARRTAWVIKGIAGLYAIDMVLREGIRMLFLPLPVSIAEAFVASLGFSALLFAIVRTRFTPASQTGEDTVSLAYPRILKIPLIIVAIVVVVASLLGYIALGRFVAGQMVLTGTTIVLIALLYLAIRAISQGEDDEDASVPVRFVARALGIKSDYHPQLSYALSTLMNVVLALVAIPMVAVSLGFSIGEIQNHGRSLLFGFEVGGVRISLSQIAIAIALFAGVMFLTRLLQRWLAKRMSANNGADRGLTNSVRTGVGYLGFAIASLVAISYGGLDITNLAIVAGALSVGIGFGLQSIVNNFVSGLILLVERPIKVGDMIEVSGGQRGHVRRISVRSTEIETFDRASVIVPNAELITGSVTNLTHQNAMGRLLIPVGVAYDSDPVLVRQILEKIANDCDLIMPYPAPSVSFDELGASSLDFTMRVYVSDINNGLSAKTELRTQIVIAFREAGIEIPYPQQDIHLRDLDGVKQMLAQAIANRAKQTNADTTGAPAAKNESAPTPKPPTGYAPPHNAPHEPDDE
ncbi:MAG: DUF3772 domain-containing protein [Hyphomicrobiaceae bacterium]